MIERVSSHFFFFFFFNDTAPTEIYTLSLHDALPISTAWQWRPKYVHRCGRPCKPTGRRSSACLSQWRSEEHTSELQSQSNLVCRLLLEKKKKKKKKYDSTKYKTRIKQHYPLNSNAKF